VNSHRIGIRPSANDLLRVLIAAGLLCCGRPSFAQSPNFTNDVVPTLARLGCNTGGCHGKAAGQNGFKLSLFGFEPEDDYRYLKHDDFGRRLNLQNPEQSLLLLKAIGSVPHGGGQLTHKNSPYYGILHRWISEGALRKGANESPVTRIEVQPPVNIIRRGGSQKLVVKAFFADGTQRDVTHLAQFKADPAEAISVDAGGLATVGDKSVSGSIMCRYQDQVAVARVLVPHGAQVTTLPPARGFIDELISKQWKAMSLPPSTLCDDATFLRRVTIDIAGRTPTPEEVEAFARDKAEDRYEKLVDRLLASEDYAYYFANKWAAVLRNRRDNPNVDSKGTVLFHKWIVKSLQDNIPFDKFVREILTAVGEEGETPQIVWYRELRDAPGLAEDAAQLFLGQKVQCAKCHHHPTERWSQRDYWALTAFFARIDVQLPSPPQKGQPKGPRKPTVVFKPEADLITHPRTGEVLAPAGLGAFPLKTAEGGDPRVALADWITDPKNPYFARTLANRYWKHFMGRGLVEPEDDMRATNPPTHPELLDALAKHFIDSKYDLKALVRAICLSSTYRLSCEPNKDNAHDRQHYVRFTVRRLPAEVLMDAINQVTLLKPMTPQSRTVRLPDNQTSSYFLKAFGKPDGASACECDRSSTHNLAQMLHMFNSSEILGQIGDVLKEESPPPTVGGKTIANLPAKVAAGTRIQKLVTDKRPHTDRIRDLYLAAFAREPSAEEVRNLEAHIKDRRDDRAAYADILWALLNSSEFMYNH